ncbi:hypothetical protein C8J95_102309 [Elizabethkingia sp. YR214]|uniref:bacteriocin-like protein n=1 Tax=Elizabethkingia sp. YR214 TaxID=2135667 RepID=UPI000D441302|nr:hypothetical protein [Elizabethkingia sp. YR214]PUB34644.1 hypothetical protein C8J95_102309 [Elizabethkingia sp. YR214]
MKNLKKLSRESLKEISGGYRMCPEDGNCGDGFCCGPGGCRSIAGAGPDTYLCSPPTSGPKIEPFPIEW